MKLPIPHDVTERLDRLEETMTAIAGSLSTVEDLLEELVELQRGQ